LVEQRARRAWTQRQGRVTGRPAEEELAPLRAVYRELHIGRDLTRLIVRLVADIPGAVRVRTEGGLIVAPPPSLAALLRLRTLIRNLPLAPESPTPAAYLVPVADTPEARADLAEAVTTGLLQDLALLNRGVDHLQAKSRVMQSGTIRDRQAQVRAIVARAEAHAELLTAAQREALTVAVDALERRLARLREHGER
jgi:hypothetical protein